MLSKFFKSIYFNAIMAVIGAFIAIIQEVSIGTAETLPFFNLCALGTVVGGAFSFAAEICKTLFISDTPYTWLKPTAGAAVGLIASIIFATVLV